MKFVYRIAQIKPNECFLGFETNFIWEIGLDEV